MARLTLKNERTTAAGQSTGNSMTLEQQRAQHAWQCCVRCQPEQMDAYTKAAKGLPALIMNSGLMQVMAFMQEKQGKNGQGHYKTLAADLRGWLVTQIDELTDDSFNGFMNELMKMDPQVFQHTTAEAFAWLRWVRQIAPAVRASQGGR